MRTPPGRSKVRTMRLRPSRYRMRRCRCSSPNSESCPSGEAWSAGHSPGAETDDHLIGALVGQRPAEQIALDGIAAEIAHALEILGGLDALGGDRHPEALGQLD